MRDVSFKLIDYVNIINIEKVTFEFEGPLTVTYVGATITIDLDFLQEVEPKFVG